MEGRRIQKAKQALVLFLQSIWNWSRENSESCCSTRRLQVLYPTTLNLKLIVESEFGQIKMPKGEKWSEARTTGAGAEKLCRWVAEYCLCIYKNINFMQQERVPDSTTMQPQLDSSEMLFRSLCLNRLIEIKEEVNRLELSFSQKGQYNQLTELPVDKQQYADHLVQMKAYEQVYWAVKTRLYCQMRQYLNGIDDQLDELTTSNRNLNLSAMHRQVEDKHFHYWDLFAVRLITVVESIKVMKVLERDFCLGRKRTPNEQLVELPSFSYKTIDNRLIAILLYKYKQVRECPPQVLKRIQYITQKPVTKQRLRRIKHDTDRILQGELFDY